MFDNTNIPLPANINFANTLVNSSPNITLAVTNSHVDSVKFWVAHNTAQAFADAFCNGIIADCEDSRWNYNNSGTGIFGVINTTIGYNGTYCEADFGNGNSTSITFDSMPDHAWAAVTVKFNANYNSDNLNIPYCDIPTDNNGNNFLNSLSFSSGGNWQVATDPTGVPIMQIFDATQEKVPVLIVPGLLGTELSKGRYFIMGRCAKDD